MTSAHALVLSGSGRYSDPWHPFEETTACIRPLLEEAGFAVTVSTDIDRDLIELTSPDLLVVNVGLPRDGRSVPRQAAAAALRRYLWSGRPLLAFHVSATSFTELPEWESALGGRWVRGVSLHPDQSIARIRVHRHPLTKNVADFDVFDERYSFLRVGSEVEVLASHDHEGITHPLMWLRHSSAPFGRAAYDALGHDGRSFESEEHLTLVRRMIEWVSGSWVESPLSSPPRALPTPKSPSPRRTTDLS